MAIHGIVGDFGSGKSTLAAYMAKEKARETAKMIAKSKASGRSIIISNIKMDNNLIKNYFYFDDDKLLQTLRTLNAVNDLERFLYNAGKGKGGLPKWQRSKFTKFYLFFDESGAIMNNHKKLVDHDIYNQYINQNRKNFQDIYIISAMGHENNKVLRSKVVWWYYTEVLTQFPFFRNIGRVIREQRDEEGNVKTKKYQAKDEKGDYVTKEKPIRETFRYIWKPSIWKYYDDLHKNISDEDKYLDINPNLLRELLEYNPNLQNTIRNTDEFKSLEGFLPKLSTAESFSKKPLAPNHKKNELLSNTSGNK